MNVKNELPARTFWYAWKSAWLAAYRNANQRKEYDLAYSAASVWTSLMLRGDKSFIFQVAEELKKDTGQDLTLKKEWYTVDALLVGPRNLVGGRDETLPYPARLACIIEHENADDVETEMWKLLHWRCPLKVLVFYDFSKADKDKGGKKSISLLDGAESVEPVDWLNKKLEYLSQMRSEVAKYHDDNSEYLFIVGGRGAPLGESQGEIGWSAFLLGKDTEWAPEKLSV